MKSKKLYTKNYFSNFFLFLASLTVNPNFLFLTNWEKVVSTIFGSKGVNMTV